MSESSKKGKSLENYIAKTLRKKLGARVQRDGRSGAGTHQKMDINDYYQETPFDIEAKNHKTVSIKEWMRQAKSGASPNRIPTVVFMADDDTLACLPFDALVDLVAESQQLRDEIKMLRAPVEVERAVAGVVAKKTTAGVQACKNGHLTSPGSDKCLAKGCPYSTSYKPKKSK